MIWPRPHTFGNLLESFLKSVPYSFDLPVGRVDLAIQNGQNNLVTNLVNVVSDDIR